MNQALMNKRQWLFALLMGALMTLIRFVAGPLRGWIERTITG